jgi:hypothetical protein
MKAERWQQIEVIFQSALALEGSERAAYLDRACTGDEALRQEVESLLAAYEKTGIFTNVPVHQVAAQLIAADYPTLQESRKDNLSASPTLPLSADVACGDDVKHETKSGSTGRRRIILVGLFFTLMSVGIGVNSYHAILYFSTAGDPGWLLGLDGRVRTYGGVSGADVSTLRDGDEVMLLDGREKNSSVLRDLRAPQARSPIHDGRPAGRPDRATYAPHGALPSLDSNQCHRLPVGPPGYFPTDWISDFSLKAG